MLDKHLIAKTRPLANAKNVVTFNEYRITVLDGRLFRIENDVEKIFEDKATQSVWYRDMQAVPFTHTVKNDCVEVTTDYVTLFVDTNNFNNSYVLIDGAKVEISNKGNLLGTYRTLDGCDADVKDPHINTKKIKIETGVCSKTGVAVIDDTQSLILDSDGKIYERRQENKDIYVFAYGNDYRSAVKALYMITGTTPIIPRYALGNWWSRYHAYTDKEYLHILDDYENAGIPVAVATIDMDWHWSNDVVDQKKIPAKYLTNEEYIGKKASGAKRYVGWTGYSWNTELFPDYKAFLKEIKRRNIKITLNLHPASGIRYFEDMYEDFAKVMGVDPSTKKCIHFDITDDNFINNYFKILHKPYENDGVDFWWIDWQQGTETKTKGLDPLWALNHYHTYDNGLNHQYPLVMSRYCKAGSHRYPFGFSGDTHATWKSLDYLPKFTNRSTNVGYTWWSHDIGGHFAGYQDFELMVRYVQYGVFNPILRLHCTDCDVITKQPMCYMNGAKNIIEDYLKFRHKFVPYIYTANYLNYKEGKPLTEPIYYAEPNVKNAYKYENTYFFGSELFVAPITSHSVDGVASVEAYIPKGRWTDMFTGQVYNGGKVVKLHRYLDSIPVLIKEGGIVPIADEIKGNYPDNPTKLKVYIANGNGNYVMYEDVDNGAKLFTEFTTTHSDGVQTVTFKSTGDDGVAPNNRTITFDFKNITTATAKLYINGELSPVKFDDNHNFTVTVDGVEKDVTYKVVVEFKEKTKAQLAIERANYVLIRAEDITVLRSKLYDAIKVSKSVSKMKDIVKNAECKQITKDLVLEAINYL